MSNSVTLCPIACQASLSMGSRSQAYWSGLPFPSPGDLLNPGIESTSPELAGRFFTSEPPGKPSSISVLSRVCLFAIPWTVTYQVPLSMGILQARILEWAAIPSISCMCIKPTDVILGKHSICATFLAPLQVNQWKGLYLIPIPIFFFIVKKKEKKTILYNIYTALISIITLLHLSRDRK